MKAKVRKIATIIEPQQVIEGAGVHLKRSIATRELNYVDPFLLLDHFDSKRRQDFEAGFPMHPHRGIQTVTYVLAGDIHHQDTLGNSGDIGEGAVQWMSSGRGIMHEEMPQVRPEGISGFQLWVNLPAKLKMSKPNYQEIRSDQIPEVTDPQGSRIKIIAGTIGDVRGPIQHIPVDPTYLDVFVPPHSSLLRPVPREHNAFAYVFEGEASFPADDAGGLAHVKAPGLVVFDEGDAVEVKTGDRSARFLLISGRPLHEPVARYGPFVMNSKEEIQQTLEDLRRGTFILDD
jgi:redox-sensitive bicupin YhaK (pirin superfamily)